MTTVNIVPLSTNNPIDLYATDVFKGVLLEWTDFEDTASTLIYRAETNNRENAVVITDCIANSYIDSNVSYNNEYFYWIKFKNIYGREDGEFYPANDLTGVSVINNQVLSVDIADDAVTDFMFLTDETTRYMPDLTAYNKYPFYSLLQSEQIVLDNGGSRLEVECGLRGVSKSISTNGSDVGPGFGSILSYSVRAGIYDATLARLKVGLNQSIFSGDIHGGKGYAANNFINLNCGANVRVDSVGSIGNVQSFSVISSNDNVAYGFPFDRFQISTSGSGTGFALTDISSSATVGNFKCDYEDRDVINLFDSIVLGESFLGLKTYLLPTIANHKYNAFVEDLYFNESLSNDNSSINVTVNSSYVKILNVKK